MTKYLKPLRKLTFVVVILVGISAVAFGSWSCHREYSGPAESITLGTVLLEPTAPIFVAEEQHLFTQNGLDITLKVYDTGLSAVNAMLNGEVDVAAPVAEYVMVAKAFNKDKIQTIASIDEVDYTFIIGRKDRGIQAISDLTGKKIGVARGTVMEFYLGRFLELHGMNIKDVVLVDTKLSQTADAIIGGDIDAVISFAPYAYTAQNKLADNVVLWPVQSSQVFYSLVICRNDWITDHPELVNRLLKSLNRAEDYIVQHPSEARVIVQKRLNLDDAYMDTFWTEHRFSLSLDESLIAAMEDEARWTIANNITTEKQVPYFLNYICIDGLEAIDPEAVKIIR
jgi:NitT/TauT family transport system substrate-binding protein